jgi:competence protein ComEC
VIITHLDEDHCGALDALSGAIPVERVFFAAGLPEAQREDKVMQTAQQLLGGDEPNELAWGDTIRLGSAIELVVLWPTSSVSDGSNEESVCLGLSYDSDNDGVAEARLLLTGDAEASQLEALLARAAEQRFTALKVGHHGSKDAVTLEQLGQMGCQLALISVGKDNRFGHPTPETLSVLEEAEVRVYRTDLNGDIRLRFDGRRISVRCDTIEE